MRSISRISSAAVVCFTLVLGIHAQNSPWVGNYDFTENGGRTAGGTGIVITHEIEVIDGGDGLIAAVKSNGYQTSVDLNCIAKADGQKLLIYFESYGEDNIFEPYKKGDLLLTLERKTIKGKEIILTYWGAFGPSIEKNNRSGKEYFKRSEKIETNL